MSFTLVLRKRQCHWTLLNRGKKLVKLKVVYRVSEPRKDQIGKKDEVWHGTVLAFLVGRITS